MTFKEINTYFKYLGSFLKRVFPKLFDMHTLKKPKNILLCDEKTLRRAFRVQ